MAHWALDLGTTNTGIARWNSAETKPELLALSTISRNPAVSDPLQAPRMIPSATHLLDDFGFWTRMFMNPFLLKRTFVGKYAHIGRPALELNDVRHTPNFVPLFKPFLGREPLRPLTRLGDKSYTARQVARTFMRELLSNVNQEYDERIRDLVITTPVDAYETYRAELSRIGKELGVKRLRFIDEPVAAALGYGLGLQQERLVLVMDFGGGTLDVALVAISARGIQDGKCKVLAKAGRGIGGNLVDAWLLEDFCKQLNVVIRPDSHDWERGYWHRLALAEARRVKEGVYFQPEETFTLTPPDHMLHVEAQMDRNSEPLKVTRDYIISVLEKNGLYESLNACISDAMDQAADQGITANDVHDVLLVGGSTLLPNVYPLVEKRFGRTKVRAFQPFEAVAYGACAYSADYFSQSDYIVHDYAFVTHNPKTNEPQYTVIVPRGTRIPTDPNLWRRRLVPTCSLGEPERIFKLVICEIGRNSGDERRFSWDADGQLRALGGEQSTGDVQLVVPLNESNPTLGTLNPPHPPSDRSPRLEISFGVNDNRWLCATVKDLKSDKMLMKSEPVIRLL